MCTLTVGLCKDLIVVDFSGFFPGIWSTLECCHDRRLVQRKFALAGILYLAPQGSNPAMVLTREVERELHDLLDAAMKGSHVQHMAKFCQKLKEHNLMYRSRVHCCHVHVHPANRDGVGVHPSEIHTLLSDIGAAGWDWKECRAVAVEVHGNVSVLNFNQNLWQSARGLLSPIEEGTVKFASLSCTHTNQVLRLFHYGMEHSDEKYTSHGKLSKEKLRLLDSEYHDAVEHGLWWDVISAEVLGKFPSLPTMLQACYNTGAQLQRKETELQLARRILALWQQKSPSGKPVEYDEIKAMCMRTKPACADSLPRMYQFILKFGGGSTATWLMETEEICRSFPPRTLGPDFWVNVSKDLKSKPFWRCRHATIQLGYIAPDKFIGANDVTKLFSASMIPTLQKAETMLETMRSKAKAANVTDFTLVHAFERSVIAVLLEKKHAEVTRVSSIEAAAALCVARVHAEFGIKICDDWDESLEPEEPVKPAASTVPDKLIVANLGSEFMFISGSSSLFPPKKVLDIKRQAGHHE